MSLIKKIRIKNFKSLEDVEIEIKPLTFLFGPNSSGKSTFLKAMMFLSKNMFPLNTGKTIYKISNDVDLGSYKDIVTNNDESREIVFEFDLEGEFEFPKIELLNADLSFLESNPEFELTRQYMNSYENENIFSVFEKLYSSNPYINSNAKKSGIHFVKHNYEITYKIKFSNFDPLYNLTSIQIKDKIKMSVYKYVRKEKLSNEFDGENGMISLEGFLFLNNKNVSKLFSHYGYVLDDYGPLFENYKLHPQFNLSKLNTLSDIKSDELNLRFDSNSSEGITISEEWKELSVNNKITFFYEILKFCYLTHRLIPTSLKNFLSYKHLPITREIPKKIYLLEKNEFDTSEYYGLLNVLSVEPYFAKQAENNMKLLSENNSYESILKKITYLNEKGIPNFTLNYGEPNEQEEQYGFSFHYNINNYLGKLGFNLFYSIEMNDDIGKILLMGKDNFKMFMSNASSGLLQVFPIIVCCCLWEMRPLKNLWELFDQNETNTSVKFLHKEIEDKIASNDYKATYSDQQKLSFLTINYNSLLIEQPELHLHPKLQSQMADMFYKATSNSYDNNKLIIETHSEHIIRKIQVLIAKGELDKDKVSVWYFDNREGTTKIKEMTIDEHGLFQENWPNGFFDDSINLTMELYDALRKRNN